MSLLLYVENIKYYSILLDYIFESLICSKLDEYHENDLNDLYWRTFDFTKFPFFSRDLIKLIYHNLNENSI